MQKEEFCLIRNLTLMLFGSFLFLGVIMSLFIFFTFNNKTESFADINQEQINTSDSTNSIQVGK